MKYKKFFFFILLSNIVGTSQLKADFYAVDNGNWNSASTWSATSGGSPGAGVPGAGSTVYIERGYTVTVTADAQCGSLSFSTATTGNLGTLTVNNGITLTVEGDVILCNASNADVSATISGDGTLNCNGSLRCGNNTAPSSGDNVRYTHTLTTSISQITLNQTINITTKYTNPSGYCDGTFIQESGTISISGVIILHADQSSNIVTFKLGNSSPTLRTSADPIFSFAGDGGATRNIVLTGTGATVDYYRTDAQPIFVTNYYNLTLSGDKVTGTKSLNGTISVAGNFTNNAIYSGGSSTVIFNGTSAQTIGGSSSTSFYNLTINNTGSSGSNTVTLQQPTTVTNTLTLTSGIVNTTSTNLLSVTNTAVGAVSGGGSSAFVNGPLNRSLPANLSSGSSYAFPVGAGTSYLPLILVNPTTGGTAPTVTIEAKTPGPGGTADNTLFSLSDTEYWAMSTTGSFTNSSISVSRPTPIAPYEVITGSQTVNGLYTSLGGTPGTYGVTNSNVIGSNRYFALGEIRNFWMGSSSSKDWGTTSNWTAGKIPPEKANIKYATVDNYGTAAINDLQLDQDRTIGSLLNETDKKLIIPAGKSLTVNNTITISDAQNPNLIQIKSGGSSTLQGTLIFHNDANHPVYATVEMYSKAWIDPNGVTNNKYFWQYFGLPLRSLQADPSFYGAYVRRWDETETTIQNHWVQLGNNDVLQSFLGYEICQSSATTYTLQGILENRDFSSGELAYTTTALYPGQHIFGNSYTAAIDITKINFGSNMEATVYLYNTGSYNNWETYSGGTSHSPSNTNPGTYAAIPQNQAGQGGIQGQIPSMQGFLVKAMSSSSGNTISISYSSVAMKNTTQQRAKAVERTAEKQFVRIDLKTDSITVDRMWLFNEPNCTRSFDNGWDGPKILPGEGVPALFSEEENGIIYQVNSVEDMNGTAIGFQGENNKVYSLEIHSQNLQQRYTSLYLYDKIAKKIIEIASDSTVYTFTNKSGTGIQQRFKIIASLNGAEGGNDKEWLRIFPLDKRIGLENRSKEEGQAIIYDLSGRMVENFPMQSQTIQMSPHDLTTGVYVVKVSTQNEKTIKKIIIR